MVTMSTSILHRHLLEGTVTGLGPPLAQLIVEYLLGFYPPALLRLSVRIWKAVLSAGS